MEGHKNKKIIRLKISGMHCIMCARSIELSLKNIAGVTNLEVNYVSGDAIIEAQEETDEKELIRRIEDLGYKVSTDLVFTNYEGKVELARIILGIVVSSLLMIIMHFKGSVYHGVSGVVIIITSILLTIFISYSLFLSAVNNLRNKVLSVDLMYSMAIFTSVVATFLGYVGVLSKDFVMPETPVMLGTFLLLGRFLEKRTRRTSNFLVEQLLKTRPRRANRIVMSGDQEDIEEIDYSEIKYGDILLVRASELIPADGEIISGSAFVDMSVITGEKRPFYLEKGCSVIAGSTNLDGLLKIRVERSGEKTFLAKIIETALNASTKKTSIERLADRIIGYFLPTVLGLAFLGGVFWYYKEGDFKLALSVFISTMVVACPCALGLATPAAITAGISRASKMGILIKDPIVFEKIGRIKSIIFDKTGTLTLGEVVVRSVYSSGQIPEKELIRIAYSLARLSTHPLNKAIINYAESIRCEPLEVAELKVMEGRGISGLINGKKYFLGSYTLMVANNIDMGDLKETGETSMWLSDDRRVLGYFILDDSVNNFSKELISLLKRDGYNVIIMSGDNEETVKRVATYVGVEDYQFKMTPDMKVEMVNKIKTDKNMVIFVGDGTNDAPALLSSDIGIALGKGTDVSVEAGDVVILKDDVRLIYSFIEIAKLVYNRIKLNLLWASLYNLILIPFTLGISYILWGIVLKPEFSAIAMIFSSLSITFLSLSIRYYKPSFEKQFN
ncbi:MAG: cation-translocating P-type ATPase [Deltaproteobacteria bacterium]|nr:cation-translocating P-type ATPase [Deltaproteobacteria bacterium]